MSYISVKQAGQVLNITRQGVHLLIKHGILDAIRVGRSYNIEIEEVLLLAAERKRNDKRNKGTSKKQSGGNLWE